MAKLTREQLNKWNAQAKGGFVFDYRYYLIWGEKELIKQIDLDDTRVLQVKICYYPEYETRANDYGCKWNVRTGREVPNVHYQVYHREDNSGFLKGYGMGTYEPIGEPQDKKKYNVLCALSATIDLDAIIKKVA